MVIKFWSIKNPLLGGVLLASTLSRVAGAAELPASQPLPTPGIPTPDQAVRRMATNMVLDSRAAAVLSNSAKSTDTAAPITPSRSISALPLTAGLPDSSRVLSSCPDNVCALVATQPPVILGTVLPSGIQKTEQSKFTNLINTPLKVDNVTPQTITPSNQITNAAKVSLSVEPGFSKDIAFGQPAKTESKTEAQITANQPVSLPTVANFKAPDKAISIVSVQNQITSFTGQLVANSWKLITVLPKPQLDSSLLNIGSSSPSQKYDSLSFNPRLTLGAAVEKALPAKVSGSFSRSPLFTTQEPIAKLSPVVIQWNQSIFFAKPLNSSKPSAFITDKGFSNFNNFEVSTKPFSLNSRSLTPTRFGRC